MSSDTELVNQIYRDFNARDVEAVLASLSEDVEWANGMDGGHVRGRDAVRAYWTRQWTTIDPHVEATSVTTQPNGSVAVDVHQVVRGLDGTPLLDETVRHVFHIEAALVKRFDIESASGLSSIVHGP